MSSGDLPRPSQHRAVPLRYSVVEGLRSRLVQRASPLKDFQLRPPSVAPDVRAQLHGKCAAIVSDACP